MNEIPTPASTGRPAQPTRRSFMLHSTAAAVGAALAVAPFSSAVYAQGNDELKIGLIGCGGRGGGAAAQALKADSNAKLVAVADAFPDKLEAGLKSLKASEFGPRVDVPDDRKFTGFDAYKGVIAASNVVLLATPPHFRPMHLRAAIDAGKHVFCEKPVAVDAPGVRHVMETSKLARAKNLSLVSGLCYRYDQAKIDTLARIHDGAVGPVLAMQTNYLTGGLWSNPRKADWSDMEWQMRNWLYFTWLSGDHIVEQHIHSLDKILWTMKDEPPAKCTASGGRTVRTGAAFGNIYDHFNTTYEWANGVRCFAACRQWAGDGIAQDVSDWVYGPKGTANIQMHRITGENAWKRDASPVNMYDAEHVALFRAIRNNQPINNGDYMCKSTLMAILGRMAAYTGKSITWEQAMNSTEDLTPPTYEFGKLDVAPVAVPGQTKFM